MKSENLSPLASFFFFEIVLTIHIVSWDMNFRMSFSVPAKTVPGTSVGIALSLLTMLCSMGILTILTLPIHEHGICFHFWYLFDFFQEYFIILTVCLSHLWLCYCNITKCFVIFNAIKSGIIFTISFLDFSLLTYANATDLCMETLYPAALMNSFINSSSFFLEPLEFYTYKIISSGNRSNFASPFLMWICFISFSCLIDLARIKLGILASFRS